jgi:hypothetical protein
LLRRGTAGHARTAVPLACAGNLPCYVTATPATSAVASNRQMTLSGFPFVLGEWAQRGPFHLYTLAANLGLR